MSIAPNLFGKNGFKTFTALGEPNRLAIVELLKDGEMTVGEIADKLQLRQPQASKHLKVLADNGVLDIIADANRRFYKLRPELFLSLEQWIQKFPQQTAERYDKLDDYLEKLDKKKKKNT